MGIRTVLKLSFACVSLSASGCATAGASPGLSPTRGPVGVRVRPIAADTWIATDDSVYGANSLVAKMPDGSVVIADTPPTQDATQRLVDWIRAELTTGRIVAINGHFHLDASGGNQAILDAGGEVIASIETTRLFKKHAPKMKVELTKLFDGKPTGSRFAETTLAPASRVFDSQEGLRMEFGGEPVQILYPGPAHTSDNVVVFFPRRSVLFGGCMGAVGPHAAAHREEGGGGLTNRVECNRPLHASAARIEGLERMGVEVARDEKAGHPGGATCRGLASARMKPSLRCTPEEVSLASPYGDGI